MFDFGETNAMFGTETLETITGVQKVTGLIEEKKSGGSTVEGGGAQKLEIRSHISADLSGEKRTPGGG